MELFWSSLWSTLCIFCGALYEALCGALYGALYEALRGALYVALYEALCGTL